MNQKNYRDYKILKTQLYARNKMAELLKDFPFVEKVYPSEANFILVKMHDAKGISLGIGKVSGIANPRDRHLGRCDRAAVRLSRPAPGRDLRLRDAGSRRGRTPRARRARAGRHRLPQETRQGGCRAPRANDQTDRH